MSLEEYREKFPDRPMPVPTRYAGKWIAWDKSQAEIIADGNSLSEVRRKAIAAGHPDPVFQSVPRGPFIG
jgi:hypothetical protein